MSKTGNPRTDGDLGGNTSMSGTAGENATPAANGYGYMCENAGLLDVQRVMTMTMLMLVHDDGAGNVFFNNSAAASALVHRCKVRS